MLACRHCRASAIHTALPGELTTDEGIALIDRMTGFGAPYPVMVLTGGDPLMRDDIFQLMGHANKRGVKFAVSPAVDIFQLMGHANKRGVKFAVSPAVTDRLTREAMVKLRDSGAASISVSLDGAVRETHDGIRTVDGTFDATLQAIRNAVDIGLGIQVNTTVMKSNVRELPRIFNLIKGLGVKVWEVFFLIKVGRGAEIEDISPAEYEGVCNFLYDASRYGVVIRTVEAPFERRVAKMRAERGAYWKDGFYSHLHSELVELEGTPRYESTIAPRGTLDGDGILFVANDGTISPGGFLPIKLGNVRTDDIVEVYRGSTVMKGIRARELDGYCGKCEFKGICGGSRSRAYYSEHSPTASDPACIYPRICAGEIGLAP
jgi:radical SAM protein with 4Fe4S-binding SPASM domain